MDNPTGRVLSLVDSPGGARAIVAVQDAPACARCAAGKGCGAGLLVSRDGEQRIEATIADGVRLDVDDRVEVTLASDNVLRAAGIVYGLPLLGALAGTALAYTVGLDDRAAVISALVGLAAGMLAARMHLRRSGCLRRFVPTIKRRC